MTAFIVEPPLDLAARLATSGRFETIAVVCFGTIEWPILAKATFRRLSGLAVSVRSGLSHYNSRTRHYLSSMIMTARETILHSGIRPSTDRFQEYLRVATSCAIPRDCFPSRLRE